MDEITRIERMIFPCPETDSGDYSRYPMIDKVRFTAMKEEYVKDKSKIYLFGFVRRERRPFLDLYIWDSSCINPQRFIIQEGYRLSEKDLDLFSAYMKDNRLYSQMDNQVKLYFDLFDVFPQWPLNLESERSIGEELERIYYMSHRSGCREILYKANLNRVADHIDRIPHNILGTSPTSIIGFNMRMKLLRILNQDELIYKLYSEDSIEECVAVYQMYASYIEELPSYMQWEYLTELYLHDEGTMWGIPFRRSIYRQLKYAEDRKVFSLYSRFFELREALVDIYKFEVPTIYELKYVVSCMEKIFDIQKARRVFDAKVKRIKREKKWYEFDDGRYIVVLPVDCMDFYKEVIHQRSCLMDYLEGHANGVTTILFVRKKADPCTSYVTMEICEDEVKQLYGRFNRLPHRDIYEFIEKYSLLKQLNYDPESLIDDAFNNLMEIDEEVWEYIEDFYRRKNKYFIEEENDISNTQLTLKDCYPELF